MGLPPSYELLERLTHDGWTQLYRARDAHGRTVLLRLTGERPSIFDDPAQAESFTAYLRAVARLEHPGIETIYEVGEHEGKPFFAGECFDWRQGLDHLLRSRERAFTTAERIAVAREVLDALAAMHGRNLVHTAVNPTNVVVLASGHIKLLNLVECWCTRRSVERGQLSGATHYLAPEFLLDAAIAPAMDIYAAGVLLYRLLTGGYPFEGSDGPAVVQNILHQPPRPVAERCAECGDLVGPLLDRALAKSPAQRYATAADFARDLAALRL